MKTMNMEVFQRACQRLDKNVACFLFFLIDRKNLRAYRMLFMSTRTDAKPINEELRFLFYSTSFMEYLVSFNNYIHAWNSLSSLLYFCTTTSSMQIFIFSSFGSMIKKIYSFFFLLSWREKKMVKLLETFHFCFWGFLIIQKNIR